MSRSSRASKKGDRELLRWGQEKLDARLAEHEVWLSERANNPGNSTSKWVDLEGLDLTGRVFGERDLDRVSFRDSILARAKLEEAGSLQPWQFQGSDLSNAALPQDVARALADPSRLRVIAETSKSCQRVLLLSVATSAYCLLTVLTTTDALLITREKSAQLPVINAEVGMTSFYWLAPALLLILFFYLDINLHRLWQRIRALPAVFRDGTDVYEKIHPWLLAGLVPRNLPRLSRPRGFMPFVRFCFAIAAGWCVVPAAILVMWLRYLPAHDTFLTIYHVLLLATVVAFSVFSFDRARQSLGKAGLKPATQLILVCVFLLLLAFAAWLSTAAIRGSVERFRADLNDAELSHPLSGWKDDEVGWKRVAPASLRNRNLRYVKAGYAFLVRADLSGADLTGATLDYADLRGADLFKADLSEGSLISADLRWANLHAARLQGANLQTAKLGEASLRTARLDGASLMSADLNGAKLRNANLKGVDLKNAILTNADFEGVTCWMGARLQGADFEGAKNLECSIFESDCEALRCKGLEEKKKKDHCKALQEEMKLALHHGCHP